MGQPHDWESVDWKELIPKLLLYTRGILARKVWYGLWAGPLPGGSDADDIVMEAIERTISGRRNWNPKKVNLYWHLVGVIRSMVSHSSDSVDNKKTSRLTYVDGDATAIDGKVVIFRNAGLDPECHVQRAQQFAQLQNYLRRKDEQLAKLAECMLVLQLSNSDGLAHLLSMSRKDVENMKKRLRRQMSNFLNSESLGENQNG